MPSISGGVNVPVLVGVIAGVVGLGLVFILVSWLYYRRSVGKGFFTADKSKTGGGAAKIKKAAAQAPNLADIGIGIGLSAGDGEAYDLGGGEMEPEMPANMRFSNGIVYADLTEHSYENERMSDPGVSAIEPAPIGRTDTVRNGLAEQHAYPPSSTGGGKLDRERQMDAYYAQHAQNRLSVAGSITGAPVVNPVVAGKLDRERAIDAYYAQRGSAGVANGAAVGGSGSAAAAAAAEDAASGNKLAREMQQDAYYAEQRRQVQRNPTNAIDLGTEGVSDGPTPDYDAPPPSFTPPSGDIAGAPLGKLERERQMDAFYADQRRQLQRNPTGAIDLGTQGEARAAYDAPPPESYDAPPPSSASNLAPPSPNAPIGKLERERQMDAFYAEQRRQIQRNPTATIDLGTESVNAAPAPGYESTPSYDAPPTAPSRLQPMDKLERERQRELDYAQQQQRIQRQQTAATIDLGTVNVGDVPAYDNQQQPMSGVLSKIDREKLRDQQWQRQQSPQAPPAAPAVVATTEEFVCVRAYNAQMPDEMELALGDRIILKQSFPDGWASGFNKTTNMEGVFPLSAVIAASLAGAR